MKGKAIIMGLLISLLFSSCLLLAPAHAMIDPVDAHYQIVEELSVREFGLIDTGSPAMEPISIEDVFPVPDGYEEHIELRDDPYIPETEAVVYYYPIASYYDIIVEKHPVQVECTEDELELLIRTMYLEAGAESDECIRAVTDVAFNQLNSRLFGDTLTQVLYRPGNYDETVHYAWTKEPSDRVREIVMDVYYNGISLPSRIIFYRNQYFHYFGIPEFMIDNVYFSSSIYYQGE